MTRQVCIYGRTHQQISCEDLQRYAREGLVERSRYDEMDRTTIIWNDEELELITLPAEHTESHVSQLREYVNDLTGHDHENWLLAAIDQFKLVQSIQYRSSSDGLNDEDNIAPMMGTQLIRHLVRHYQGALFVHDSLYRESGELIAGPPHASPRLLWDRLLDANSTPKLTRLEEARWKRTCSHLKRRRVPLPEERLTGFGDENTVRLRDSHPVAERLLVVSSIVRAATDPAKEVTWLRKRQLNRLAFPHEHRFWQADLDESGVREAHWHVESLWTLLWSLGYIANFNWPGVPSDDDEMENWLEQLRDEPERFLTQPQLRRVDEILDASDLINHLQWAIDDARRHDRLLPRYLVWSDKREREVPITECLAAGVVEQRQRVLNWLVEGQRWET